MKNKLIIASATVTGTAIFNYLVKRRKRNLNIPIPVQNHSSHHLTNILANAKKRMSNI